MSGLFGGTQTTHLACCKAGRFTLPPQKVGNPQPSADKTIGEFAASLDPSAAEQMWNRSKKCPSCSKVNAVSMTQCNGCGFSLAETPESKTENVPMGFVYGVRATERFPLKLSLRYEDPTTIVYDDPLARATCHMNAIPTEAHLPDWRWLLTRPAAALKLLHRLDDAAWSVVETQYYGNEAWRSSVLRPGAIASASELRAHCVPALNAVVSQYQLHMHYIVPPFRPDSYHSLLRGERFQKGRWLPMEYVYAALAALGADGIPDAPSKETAELLEIIEARGGPNYSNLYEAEMARNRASHEQLANWSADAFDAVATVEGEGTAAVYTLARTDGGAADAKDAAKEDGKLLSSYGWGAEGGAPAPLSFYAHAKKPADVLSCEAWSKAGA